MNPPTSSHTPEKLSFDIVIIGGGLAGICAAIGAAREGVKVCLIQERPVLGGNSSSEIRVVPHGAAHSNPWAAETGVMHEFLLECRATSHEHHFDHGMIGSHWDMLLREFVRRESNITLFLNTSVRGVETELLEPDRAPEATPNGLGRLKGSRRRIASLHAIQLGSEREFHFTAPQFIDATGDGSVGFWAGADYRYGREARSEFNETLAPAISDDVTMGSTITMRAMNLGKPTPFNPPPWIQEYTSPEDFKFDRHLVHLNRPSYGGYWWLEISNPYHQIRDNAAIREELHRHILGVWNYIKNHSPMKETAANYVLDWIGQVPGKRESRRLMGDVLVTEQNCHHDPHWQDAFGLYGWWIDLHNPGGILNQTWPGERENIDVHHKLWIRIASQSLPLRAHYSRNVENLWLAGRCVSVTHTALGPMRVMQTLGQLGQGVGIAAATAVKQGVLPRPACDASGALLPSILQAMLRQDVRVPRLKLTDPMDIGQRATVNASSTLAFNQTSPHEKQWHRIGASYNGWPQLEAHAWGAIIPVGETLRSVRLYLSSELDESATLKLSIQPVDNIWERYNQPETATGTATLPAHYTGWIEFPITGSIQPQQPHRIALHAPIGVAWAASKQFLPGTAAQGFYASPGGPEEKNRHLSCFAEDEVILPPFSIWRGERNSMAVHLDPDPMPFTADESVNGRAWCDDRPNLWISDPAQPLPQSLDLEWPDAVTMSRVCITFDTDLASLLQMADPFHRPPECAKDWRLLVDVGGQWQEVFHEQENYQRCRTARFSSVTTNKLRLEILSTNRASEARVYQMCVYER